MHSRKLGLGNLLPHSLSITPLTAFDTNAIRLRIGYLYLSLIIRGDVGPPSLPFISDERSLHILD